MQAPGDMESHRQSALMHFYQAQGLIHRLAGILKQVSQTLTPVPSSRSSGDPTPPKEGIPLGGIKSGKASLVLGGAPPLQVPENPAESTRRGRGLQKAVRPREKHEGSESTDLGYHPAAHFLSDVNGPNDLSPLLCEMGTNISLSQRVS